MAYLLLRWTSSYLFKFFFFQHSSSFLLGASSYTFQIIAITPGIPQNLIELNTEDNTLVITGLESGVEYSITGFSLGIQTGRRSVSQEVTESTRKKTFQYNVNKSSYQFKVLSLSQMMVQNKINILELA